MPASVALTPLPRGGWAWIGLVVAGTGAGLLLVGVADAASRAGSDVAIVPFWLGMLAIFGPATWRLLSASPRTSRRAWLRLRAERLAIVVVLGLGLYLVKVMVSPTALTLPDEFSHLRTLADIIRTGHLFADNPLLRISSIYPGLEAASAAVMASSHLDAFAAAVPLIAVARVTTILAIYLIALRVTGSTQAGGIAIVLYAANPSFLMFDAAYAYESLALPLALVAIWATLRWSDHLGRSLVDAAVALTAIGATAVTHHLTSVVLMAFLATWAIAAVVLERGRRTIWPIVLAAVVAVTASAIWLAVAGTLAVTYLTTIVGGGVQELVGILLGAGDAKRLFAPHAGFSSPPPEVVAAWAAVGLLLLGLPLVLWHAIRRRGGSAILVTLGLLALLYPATLALRLTVAGSETSQRASEFVFLGIGVLGADWLVGPRRARLRPPRLVAWLAVLVVVAGGIVAGEPPIGRLPGPYHVAAEQRSIEPEGVATAMWALEVLGPDRRLVADRTNAKLLGSLGLQYPVTAANQHVATAWPMFDTSLTPADVALLQRGGIEYVVVDLRLAADIPAYAYVFEQDEPNAGNHTTPMPLPALQKWDSIPGVTRIYDSGDIVIYDIRGLADAAS